MGGLGIYFIALLPPLLPEVPMFTGSTLEQLRRVAPGLGPWLRIVFTVMGGYIAGASIMTVFVARVALAHRFAGTGWAIALAVMAITACDRTSSSAATHRCRPHVSAGWHRAAPGARRGNRPGVRSAAGSRCRRCVPAGLAASLMAGSPVVNSRANDFPRATAD